MTKTITAVGPNPLYSAPIHDQASGIIPVQKPNDSKLQSCKEDTADTLIQHISMNRYDTRFVENIKNKYIPPFLADQASITTLL